MKINDLFDLDQTLAKQYLNGFDEPWEILPKIKEIILKIGPTLSKDEYVEIKPQVWVHVSAKIANTVEINAPAIIDKNAEIRHGAYIRGSALIGESCVVGNSVEVKNAIFFNNAKAPHFNYVGDSIMGANSHVGAGVITSNVKNDKSLVTVLITAKKIPTGLKKFGAMIGDNVEVGCNSVLNPGTVLMRGVRVYPLCSVRGLVEEDTILKSNGQKVKIRK